MCSFTTHTRRCNIRDEKLDLKIDKCATSFKFFSSFFTQVSLTIWQFLSRSSSTDLHRSWTSENSRSFSFSWSSSEWISEILSRNEQFFSSNSRFQSLMTSLSEFPLLKLLSPLSGELDVNSPIVSACISLPSCNNTIAELWLMAQGLTNENKRFFFSNFHDHSKRFHHPRRFKENWTGFFSRCIFVRSRESSESFSFSGKIRTNIFAFNMGEVAKFKAWKCSAVMFLSISHSLNVLDTSKVHKLQNSSLFLNNLWNMWRTSRKCSTQKRVSC